VADDRYRLSPVREARARDERVRRGDLAAAIGDARETQGRLEAARARTVAARTALAGAVATRDSLLSGTPDRLVMADRFVARRRRDLADALAEEARAEDTHDARLGHVDAARSSLTRARAEREVIERHFERWRTERKKLAERRED
jgi:hypothetical protein